AVMRVVLCLLLFLLAAAAQGPPSAPDTNLQRQAMKKLGFLVGEWVGDGRMLRPGGEWIGVSETGGVGYKVDGLWLGIEGTGRAKSDGKPLLQAYGIVSYDDTSGKYHMRAFNDGRWLETDVALADNGKELTWGFVIGDVHTNR